MVRIQEARKYQAFYTKSTTIVNYMVKKLSLKNDDKIFEPCGGDGVFIDSILESNKSANIDVCELNEDAFSLLKEKFADFPSVRVQYCDTLLEDKLIRYSNNGGVFDKIIGNPPYGAWQDYEKREKLKKAYPNLYTKETYVLFLYRCVELLKENGMLSFIIPDTFLNLHMHKEIRKHILSKTKILELALFPSSFFPGVNFGYANLSIITLQKCDNEICNFRNEFSVITGFTDVSQLSDATDKKVKKLSFLQSEIFANPDHAFFITDNSKVSASINNTKVKIGDIASCVTGFYSGNDKAFLKVNSPNLKNGKNYGIVEKKSINKHYRTIPDLLVGIDGEKHFLPILKGGNIKYLKPDHWFMNWSKEAVRNYKTNKKARFQNPQFYFKFGIGVPMVSSSRITASLIENKLFDQSIVGIFPKDEKLTLYLLAFFNSPTCNTIIRTINPSANNPANYIKKIPFIKPTDTILESITKDVDAVISSIKLSGSFPESIEHEIHKKIKNLYGF